MAIRTPVPRPVIARANGPWQSASPLGEVSPKATEGFPLQGRATLARFGFFIQIPSAK